MAAAVDVPEAGRHAVLQSVKIATKSRYSDAYSYVSQFLGTYPGTYKIKIGIQLKLARLRAMTIHPSKESTTEFTKVPHLII